jgi:hypothetical protein
MDGDEELEELFQHMKETSSNRGVRAVCQSDQLIREFGRSLLGRLGTVKEQRRKDKDNIRSKCRAVGRLLLELNDGQQVPNDLSHFICGNKFQHVVRSVKKMAVDTDSPSLATSLGHYLKQIALLKMTVAIMQNNEGKKKEPKNFLHRFEAHWCNQVAAVANRRIRLRDLNEKNSAAKD